jgi:cytidylate kinase
VSVVAEKPFIVAISGKSGCGNTTVSRLLAERLGFRLVNYTLRNMARERFPELPEGEALAKVLDLAKTDDSWDRSLDARQAELAREGDCVIGSRLAAWIVPEAGLKVYLYGSAETRAERIHFREGGSHAEKLAFTAARDSGDHARYLELYGIDNDDYRFCDLVVNTERYGVGEEVDLLEAAARLALARRG